MQPFFVILSLALCMAVNAENHPLFSTGVISLQYSKIRDPGPSIVTKPYEFLIGGALPVPVNFTFSFQSTSSRNVLYVLMRSSSKQHYDTGLVRGDIILHHPTHPERDDKTNYGEFFRSERPDTNPWFIMRQDGLLAGGYYDEKHDRVNITITMQKQ